MKFQRSGPESFENFMKFSHFFRFKISSHVSGHLALTETADVGLADAASELAGFLRLKAVVVACTATVDELETAIGRLVVVPRRPIVVTVASCRSQCAHVCRRRQTTQEEHCNMQRLAGQSQINERDFPTENLESHVLTSCSYFTC